MPNAALEITDAKLKVPKKVVGTKLGDFVSPIRGAVLHYAWGRVSEDSVVAALSKELYHLGTPCAELWLGTHCSGVARLVDTGESLLDVIQGNSSFHTGGAAELPFLLKVLAIAKPLSIQIHPDKAAAVALHASKPELYPDANHKPEMAVALTPVRLLYGFRPLSEIIPIAIAIVGSSDGIFSESALKAATPHESEVLLRSLIRTLLDFAPEAVARVVKQLDVSLLDVSLVGDGHAQLFKALRAEFGDEDTGVLLSLLMNIVELKVGEAIFIQSNTPHAYLSGDLVECMAASDNVIRAGLTPKHKDIETAVSLLCVQSEAPKLLTAERLIGGGKYFPCPVDDFCLRCFSGESASVAANSAPRILCCVEGQGSVLGFGEKIFIEAGDALFISAGLTEALSYDASNGVFFEATSANESLLPAQYL
jgi:mannose-6-phosphate isomerase